MSYSTCRICKHVEYESGQPNVSKFPMIKYSTRHYAHADCALKYHGMEFFKFLTTWQVTQFPVMACYAVGLPGAIRAELRRRRMEAKHEAER